MPQGWFNGVHSNYKPHTYSRHTVHAVWNTQTQRLTFGLTVPEGDWSFVLGHETSSAGEAEDAAWFWLVGTQRTELAWTEAVSREMTRWTLTWGEGQRKNHLASFFMFSTILLRCDLFGFVACFRYCLKCECKWHNVNVFLRAEWVGKYLSHLGSPQIPQ